MLFLGMATATLVEAPLRPGAEGDVADAHTATENLAAIPTDPGLVLYEVPLLRAQALLAQTNGDQEGIAASGTATENGLRSWGLRGTSRSPRRCRDRYDALRRRGNVVLAAVL
jgi:hypothetical protein